MRKVMSKTPSIKKQGVAMAKVVAKQLPPKAKKSWWDSVKKAAAMGASVYRTGKKIYGYAKAGARMLDRYGERYIVPVNDWIHDNLWTPFWNGAGRAGMAGLGAVGTALATVFTTRGAPMYDHPIGPPNIGEDIMGINFNGHY